MKVDVYKAKKSSPTGERTYVFVRHKEDIRSLSKKSVINSENCY